MLKIWVLVGTVVVGVAGCAAPQTTVKSTKPAANTTVKSKRATTNRVQVTIAGQRLTAHFNQSQPARQLGQRLPATFRFNGMGAGNPERTSDLKQALRYQQTPNGANPRPGDIAYWSPQPRLVFYWGDVDYYAGIHVLGHFDQRQRAIKIIRQQHNPFVVKISAE
ncbi:cyclophilin-like fold protein [Levilactobacillus fujinensis]|uniref:Cyclophilin-like fold protein n=1 Tax=Levilactobacillus fujinensis TaxID=2486024 RepID=A0ABW1TG21_9LACO|nr:cyclophilin-like fold protein [Levilactobacillus fujinensis]